MFELLCYFSDTMICTGCCATLDNIITYLLKRLTRKQTKPLANQLQDSEAFVRILELHPEILQQVHQLEIIWSNPDWSLKMLSKMLHAIITIIISSFFIHTISIKTHISARTNVIREFLFYDYYTTNDKCKIIIKFIRPALSKKILMVVIVMSFHMLECE